MSTAQVVHWVWCYLYALVVVAGGSIQQSTFFLIPTKYNVEDCLLAKTTFTSSPYPKMLPYFQCAKKCMADKNCNLFCLSPDLQSCSTFSLYMSSAFLEKAFGSANLTPFLACYSSWAHGRNLITSTMRVKSSAPTVESSSMNKAIDGICCLSSYKSYRFRGATNQSNEWLVDLQQVVTVAELRIVGSVTYFHSVSIHFGNSTDNASNPVIAKIGAGVGDNRVYLKPKATGRYLTLKSATRDMFDVCEVQVIPVI
ncbi:Galactose-binding domain-like [Trinorchestia longiramus]|nr:Galactose-binding domain-like [Trinorchestia longiramus]